MNAIELEVFRHLFASIAEEMGATLMRSAYSPNIKERRDFSCALFDAAGEMIAQAAHIPVHLGSTPDRKSTRLNSSHVRISYAVFCLKKKNNAASARASVNEVNFVILSAQSLSPE